MALDRAIREICEDRKEFTGGGETVGDLMRQYVEEKRQMWAPSTTRDAVNCWGKHIFPAWDKVPKDDWTAERVADFLMKFRLALRKKVRLYVSGFITWSIERRVLPAIARPPSVKATTRREKIELGGKRERFLALPEVRDVLRVINEQIVESDALDIAAATKVLLYTGQRLTEIALLDWSEINRESRVIKFPPGRMKAGRPHTVALSSGAIDAINAVTVKPVGQVFRGDVRHNINRFRREKLVPVADEPFIQHDFRRTMATHLSDLGVPRDVIDAMLAHSANTSTKNPVTSIYNLSPLAMQTAEGWALWGQVLDWLATGPDKLPDTFDLATVKRFLAWREQYPDGGADFRAARGEIESSRGARKYHALVDKRTAKSAPVQVRLR